MSRPAPAPVDLWEHQTTRLSESDLREQDGELLWRHHGKRVDVQFPSARTGGRWELVPRGWVGFLPVSPTLVLRLHPKVPLHNIFRMLETAFHLKSFELLEGLADCRSLEEFYQRLAKILALRVLSRSRKGLHREYVNRRERLATVRGRIDLAPTLRASWHPGLDCRFEEHTADNEDNRLLLWTLDRVRRSGACRRPEVRQAVRAAFGRLQHVAIPQPFTAADCIDRTYSRLNDDYRPLHALCRFFLEHTGPSHEGGDHRALPFLVDMARLFELFVAEWLVANLPRPLSLASQETVHLDPGRRLRFSVDMILYDAPGGRPVAVLDTKYKDTQTPAASDIAQVIAYAEAKGCNQAVLIYPVRLERELDLVVGRIRVRTLGFPLTGDLDHEGRRLLDALLSRSPTD